MIKLLAFIVPVLLLTACDQAVETQEETIRAVKTLVIGEASKANSRQISGIVSAADESALSFRVSGRVASVAVKAGDSVTARQVLARIDQKDHQLTLEKAQANLASARADMAEKKDNLTRQTNLKKKDFVSQAAVDKATTAYQSARSDVSVAQAGLKAAQNDLDDTTLRAPFPGKIAERLIDPFVEVQAGKTIFQLQSEGGYKVDVLMPETLIRDVSYGDAVSIRFPTLKDTIATGAVSEIGVKAEAGNAFPVKIELVGPPSDIRAGMTAQVIFNFGESVDKPIFLIPISALDLRIEVNDEPDPERKAKIFLFNKENNIVEQQMVSIRDVRGNTFEVVDGLKTGDILIIAGVPFLSEGQKVKQWQPGYSIPATLGAGNQSGNN